MNKKIFLSGVMLLVCLFLLNSVWAAGTTPNGNSCYQNGDCQSGYCDLSNPNDEFGTGVCAANSPASNSGGCCVIDAGNCLDTSGSSCSANSVFFPSPCSQLATCSATGAPASNPSASGEPASNPTNGSSKLSGTGIVIPEGTGLPDPPGGIAAIVKNLLTWLLGIVGVIALIGFIISGVQYLTSAGDEDRMQSAKRNLLYSIIGVVVVLASFVIIQAIDFALRANSSF